MSAFLMLTAVLSLAEGVWGGTHIEMTVGPEGATVEMDCAHGAVREPIAIGKDGRFHAAGTYVAERGGPVREGEEGSGRPAVYEGKVEGKTMTLVIKVAEEEIGTFQLTHGRAGRIRKCL